MNTSIAGKINRVMLLFSGLPDFDGGIVTRYFCIGRRDPPSRRQERANRSTPTMSSYLLLGVDGRIQREPITLAVKASPRIEVEFMHAVGAPDTPSASPEAMKEADHCLSRVHTLPVWQSPV